MWRQCMLLFPVGNSNFSPQPGAFFNFGTESPFQVSCCIHRVQILVFSYAFGSNKQKEGGGSVSKSEDLSSSRTHSKPDVRTGSEFQHSCIGMGGRDMGSSEGWRTIEPDVYSGDQQETRSRTSWKVRIDTPGCP